MNRRLHTIILIIVFFSWVPSVSAHTLKIDGAIGVNLHVDPDDAPVGGVESKFLLDITDKNGRFNPNNPANCECTLTILKDGTVIKTLPVVAGGSYAQLRYTFPQSGIYTVVVEGKPKGEGVPFQSFRTEFEYFVKSGLGEDISIPPNNNALAQWLPYVVLVMGIFLIALFVL